MAICPRLTAHLLTAPPATGQRDSRVERQVVRIQAKDSFNLGLLVYMGCVPRLRYAPAMTRSTADGGASPERRHRGEGRPVDGEGNGTRPYQRRRHCRYIRRGGAERWAANSHPSTTETRSQGVLRVGASPLPRCSVSARAVTPPFSQDASAASPVGHRRRFARGNLEHFVHAVYMVLLLRLFRDSRACVPADRTCGVQILTTASPRCILSILAAVCPPVHSTANADPETAAEHDARLRYLLQIVHPALHPPLLHARYPSIHASRSLSLPRLPRLATGADPLNECASRVPVLLNAVMRYYSTPPPQPAAGGGGNGDTGTGGKLASELILLVTLSAMHDRRRGASPPRKRTRSALRDATPPVASDAVATGSNREQEATVDIASTGDGSGSSGATSDEEEDPSASNLFVEAAELLAAVSQREPEGIPALSELIPSTSRDPSASLTRLSFSVDPIESREAFEAVAQLRMLRTLALDVRSVGDVDILSLGTTLHSLPELSAFHISAAAAVRVDTSDEPCMRHLLHIVSHLPRLAALTLDHCFSTDDSFCRWRDPVQVDTTVDQLSRLTGLTFLSMRDNVIRRRDVGVKLGKALRRMKNLRQLSVAHTDVGIDIALEVYCTGGFPALEGLDLGCFDMNLFGMLCSHLAAEGTAAGLTALALERGGCQEMVLGTPLQERLLALPRAFPLLRRLNLRDGELDDDVLRGLARVMPELLALEDLDISFPGATHEGLFAVLGAAPQVYSKGGSGLRRLSVEGARVGPKHAADLCALLPPLITLEDVNVAWLDLRAGGVRAMLHALAQLPELRGVNLSDNGLTEAEIVEVVPLLAALTRLQRLVMHGVGAMNKAALRRAVEKAVPGVAEVTLSGWPIMEDEKTEVVVWGQMWEPRPEELLWPM